MKIGEYVKILEGLKSKGYLLSADDKFEFYKDQLLSFQEKEIDDAQNKLKKIKDTYFDSDEDFFSFLEEKLITIKPFFP